MYKGSNPADTMKIPVNSTPLEWSDEPQPMRHRLCWTTWWDRLRLELQVLVCCARVRLDLGEVERLRTLLRGDLDWDFFWTETIAHGMRPLAGRHLRDLAPDLLPQPVLQRIDGELCGIAARNLGLGEQLLSILNTLDEGGVLAVPYRGLVLAASLYGRPALREFGDLDILVSRRQIGTVRRLLETHGYRLLPRHARKLDGRYPHRAFHYQFVPLGAGQALIEIHCEPTVWAFGMPWDVDELLTTAEWVALGGTPVRSIARSQLFLLLCVNATKDGWSRLEHICALAALINGQPHVSWTRVLAEAERLGALRITYVGLQLATALGGAEPPLWVERVSRSDRTVNAAVTRLVRRLFLHGGGPHRLWCYYVRLLLRDCWRDRISYYVRDMWESACEPSLARRS